MPVLVDLFGALSAEQWKGRNAMIEEKRNSTVTLDPDFGRDLEAVIAGHQPPWNPQSWE
jgi:hypothetical protein